MKVSESIINNLLFELESLTYRLRNIKQSFKTTLNTKLRQRLIYENKSILKRVNEINKVSKLLNNRSSEKINYSALLVEISERTMKEIRTESNLFFL